MLTKNKYFQETFYPATTIIIMKMKLLLGICFLVAYLTCRKVSSLLDNKNGSYV